MVSGYLIRSYSNDSLSYSYFELHLLFVFGVLLLDEIPFPSGRNTIFTIVAEITEIQQLDPNKYALIKAPELVCNEQPRKSYVDLL